MTPNELMKKYEEHDYKVYSVGKNFRIIYFDVRHVPADVGDRCWFFDYAEAEKYRDELVEHYEAEG